MATQRLAQDDLNLIRAFIGGKRADKLPTMREFYADADGDMVSYAHFYTRGVHGKTHYYVHAWDRESIIFATVDVPDDGYGPVFESGTVDMMELLLDAPAYADFDYRAEPYLALAVRHRAGRRTVDPPDAAD